MQKWEYCIFTAYETSQQSSYTVSFAGHADKFDPKVDNRLTILEKLGRDGWELVAVHPLASGLNEFYFKRAVS